MDCAMNEARAELYRGQCNCAYWHGAFGGVYLPHLRNAIFTHLLKAENRLLAVEHGGKPFVAVVHKDLNIDGKPDVRIDNDKLAAFFNPSAGGSLYELDVRAAEINLGDMAFLELTGRRPVPTEPGRELRRCRCGVR